MKTSYAAVARDALLLSPRLARAAWQVWRAPTKSPRLARLTDADWLAARLNLHPAQIEEARIEAVHAGTATRSRLIVRYANDPRPLPGPPSLFIKSSPSDAGSALFGVLFDLGGNEVRFYRELRAEVPVEAPRVYFAEGDSRDYLMLLEDLALEGCEFATLATKCTLDQATSVVTTLAQLHARFWASPRFDADLAWVKRLETNRDHRLLSLVRQLSVPIAFERYGDVLPREIADVVPHLLAHYLELEAQWAAGPRTLLHGDAHLGNMYFHDGRAGLLDWQVLQHGQGMRDVSYFLVNSLPDELRLAHQAELIRHYIATLKELGVSFDFDTAWRQHRLQSVYAWIAGVVTAPSNFQERSVVAAGLSRASRAVLDLDAVSLIRDL